VPSALSVRLASSVMLASQHVPRLGIRPSYSSLPAGNADAAKFQFEFDDAANFLENIPDIDFPALVADKTVLDFGSGYGGRTAWMSQWAGQTIGIEAFPRMVDAATACVADRRNCRFVLGGEDRIDLATDSIDILVTFDVMEHVKRPDVMIREFHRVLKPGGTAIVIFTPYWGAFSHHLNYVSLAPGLHWMFSPETLMAATKRLADGPLHGQIHLQTIPDATRSYDDRRSCIPTINGMTKRDFARVVAQSGFETRQLRTRPLLEKYRVAGHFGALLNQALCAIPGLDEPLGFNLTAILSKPPRR
jgi:SAM-dependent methyltransferase